MLGLTGMPARWMVHVAVCVGAVASSGIAAAQPGEPPAVAPPPSSTPPSSTPPSPATDPPAAPPEATDPDAPAAPVAPADPDARPLDLAAPAVSAPPLADALADVEPPIGWAHVDDARVVWRTVEGLFVSVDAQPGTCVAQGGVADARHADYFVIPVASWTRITRCLQRATDAVIVVAGDVTDQSARAVTNPDVDLLLDQIAARLHPPVTVPVVNVTLSARLALEATADGFAIHGLAEPTVVSLALAAGSCATLPPDRARRLRNPAPAMVGDAWGGDPVGDRHTLRYCVERRDDAVVVIVEKPADTDTDIALVPALADVLAALHDGIVAAGPTPRWFGGRHAEVALPHAGFTLRATAELDNGWMVTAPDGGRWKVVDGAAWGAPGTDLLLPTRRYRYAVGVLPVRCAMTETGGARVDVFPRELGAATVVGDGPTWSASACAVGPGGSYAVFARVLDADAPRAPRRRAGGDHRGGPLDRRGGGGPPDPHRRVRGAVGAGGPVRRAADQVGRADAQPVDGDPRPAVRRGRARRAGARPRQRRPRPRRRRRR